MLRNRFRNLTEQTVNTTDPANPTTMPLSAGQSLVAACNAVFQQLLVPVVEFVAHMEDLPVPQEWRRVDVIQDAKGLKVSIPIQSHPCYYSSSQKCNNRYNLYADDLLICVGDITLCIDIKHIHIIKVVCMHA